MSFRRGIDKTDSLAYTDRHRGVMMAVSAARGKNFTLRQVTAALSQDFPCELSFKRTFDRYGELRLVPILIFELGETDFQTLQDVAGVGA